MKNKLAVFEMRKTMSVRIGHFSAVPKELLWGFYCPDEISGYMAIACLLVGRDLKHQANSTFEGFNWHRLKFYSPD